MSEHPYVPPGKPSDPFHRPLQLALRLFRLIAGRRMDGRTDWISPHSTGLCPLMGSLLCYPLRLHNIKESRQGNHQPRDACWRLVSLPTLSNSFFLFLFLFLFLCFFFIRWRHWRRQRWGHCYLIYNRIYRNSEIKQYFFSRSKAKKKRKALSF